MPYRKTYKSEVDQKVLTELAICPHTVSALVDGTGLRIGAVRNSLKRLYGSGKIVRSVIENERHGIAYVYAHKENQSES